MLLATPRCPVPHHPTHLRRLCWQRIFLRFESPLPLEYGPLRFLLLGDLPCLFRRGLAGGLCCLFGLGDERQRYARIRIRQ